MSVAIDINPLAHSWEARVGAIRVLGGRGRLSALGELVSAVASSRPLVVTDRGLLRAGHVDHALESLTKVADVRVFDGAEENPTTTHVESGVAFAQDHKADSIVALGGGSAMDCAKGINFLFTNGGKMEDYWGTGKAKNPMLPSIGIPSTCGTGSEAQSYALIAQLETHRKMACGDPKALFHAVILDPEVAATAPDSVAARTGMDALSHAIETLVTTRGTKESQALAKQAWNLLAPEYLSLLQGSTLESAAKMQLGACLAGAAIEASMLGAAHAAANPLTARNRIIHGEAVGLMLPGVIRFNSAERPQIDQLYSQLEPDGGMVLADRISHLRRDAGLPERLSDLQVERADLPELARLATQEWTGTFNPRAVTETDFLELYEEVY